MPNGIKKNIYKSCTSKFPTKFALKNKKESSFIIANTTKVIFFLLD